MSRHDRIDLALTRLPLDPDRHAWNVLFTEPRVLGVSTRHPLADANSVAVDDVTVLPMPMYDPTKAPQQIGAYWSLNDYRNR
jgi:DNA-binding transcriptional LysR family regulator